jgi:hypothetical protein
MSLDKEGRIIDVDKIKERFFRGGLESNILRQEVWKFLLNYYPWSSTRDERIKLAKQRESEYFAMKLQWKSTNEQQKQRNSLFRDRESLIGEEIIRSLSKLLVFLEQKFQRVLNYLTIISLVEKSS